MEHKIRHGRHPVLDWNMGNVIVDQDAAGNIKPNKQKSTEKIDGAVAMIMGFAEATIGGGIPDSVYNHRGILFI
jgi:phage terminase large subunit-like protein